MRITKRQLKRIIKEETMYHSTDPKNAAAIQQSGLEVGRESAHTTGGEWADEYYGTRPVYVSVQKGTYEGKPLAIDTSGLDMVADLPGLVDTGAYIEEEGVWWDEGSEPEDILNFAELVLGKENALRPALAGPWLMEAHHDVAEHKVPIDHGILGVGPPSPCWGWNHRCLAEL